MGKLFAHLIEDLAEVTDFIGGFNRHMRRQLAFGNLIGHRRQTANGKREPKRQPVCSENSHKKNYDFNTKKPPA